MHTVFGVIFDLWVAGLVSVIARLLLLSLRVFCSCPLCRANADRIHLCLHDDVYAFIVSANVSFLPPGQRFRVLDYMLDAS